MKTKTYFIVLMAGLFLASCQTESSTASADTNEETVTQNASLTGVWKLVSYQNQEGEMVAPEFNMYKIIGDKAFALIRHKEDGEFLLALGGPVSFEGQSFTEKIDFLSSDSTGVGMKFTYKYTLDGNQMHQSGILNGMADDGGDFVIEEDYERVEDYKGDTPISGFWQMEKAAYDDETEPTSPEMLAYKIITPSHFYAVQFDYDNKKFGGVVFGTYQMGDGTFSESVISSSWEDIDDGGSYTFDYEVSGNTFIQKGVFDYGEDNHYVIEEHYKAF